MRIDMKLALAAATLAALPALAADPVTDAMQAAYVPYRAALFRTNSKAQAESEQAVAQAQQAWQSLTTRFAAKPPPPYERDAQFAASLAQVAAVYERAAQQVRDKQLGEAHETLEQVRELMAGLRQRNDVVVYSDTMNAYHAEMEHVLQQGPQEMTAAQGPMLLMARVGTLDYLVRRLRTQAPASLLRDAEFMPLLQGVEASVAGLRTAVLSQDAGAVRDAIGKLKGPYSRLFLKFG